MVRDRHDDAPIKDTRDLSDDAPRTGIRPGAQQAALTRRPE
jgi:hypothetical protein